MPLTPDLRRVHDEGLHFRAVAAVRESGAQLVYDLAVPATEAFVANGIVNHNTVNAPNHHTVAEVQRLYMSAFDQGCKGVTYYRDGSRDAVLTHIEEKKEAPAEQALAAAVTPPLPTTIRPRPAVLHGYTRNIKAPEGTVNITVNSDDGGPLEVFVNVGRGGSDVAALAEALGRLISSACASSPIPQEEKLREMALQLRGIGGSRTIGFGPEQVRSLPDAVGKALGEHLDGHPALQPNPLQLRCRRPPRPRRTPPQSRPRPTAPTATPTATPTSPPRPTG